MSFLLVALSFAITASAAKPFRLVTPADSLNYALGMTMSSTLRSSMPQKYLGSKRTKKILASYAKGFENVYFAEKGSSEYITLVGYWAGGDLVKEFSSEFFFGDSTLRRDPALIIEGFRVGVSGSDFLMNEEESHGFIQWVVGHSYVIREWLGEVNLTERSAATLDSFNLCFGYITGFQTRRNMLLGDTTPANIKTFMQGFDKGIKIRKSSYPENRGMEIAFRLSQQLGETTHIKDFEEFPISREAIGYGFVDALRGGKCLMDEAFAVHYSDSVVSVATARRNAILKATADSFLVENAKRPEVVVTASGLQYEGITDAEGPKPADTDTIAANYLGSFIDGTVFENDEYFEFIPSYVVSGLKEGIQLMSKGAKYRFFIPYNLAYGEKGCNDIPPYSVLVFEVELVDFRPAKNDF